MSGYDLWQQGGNPTLLVMAFVTTRARDKALDLDRRTVFRQKQGILFRVAVFDNEIDARLTVEIHNRRVNELRHQHLDNKLGTLLEKTDSGILGDPVL